MYRSCFRCKSLPVIPYFKHEQPELIYDTPVPTYQEGLPKMLTFVLHFFASNIPRFFLDLT